MSPVFFDILKKEGVIVKDSCPLDEHVDIYVSTQRAKED
jgi:hypothetical protein